MGRTASLASTSTEQNVQEQARVLGVLNLALPDVEFSVEAGNLVRACLPGNLGLAMHMQYVGGDYKRGNDQRAEALIVALKCRMGRK